MKILRFIVMMILFSSVSIVCAQSTVEQSESNTDSVKYEKELMEIEVKVNRKYVKPTGRGIKVSMAGNPVAKLGSAAEMMKQLPMIDTSKGGIDILGHGTPQIYINNKLVSNASELTSLSAADIKDVEIVTNPSAKYGTDVSSVILIRTKKHNEGFHAIAAGNGAMSEAFSASGDVNVNYHTESGFTFFGDFSYGTSAYRQKRYYGEKFYIPGESNEVFHTQTHSNARSRSRSFSADGGVNYDFGKHSVGVKYYFYHTPKSHYYDNANTETDAREDVSVISSCTDLNSNSSTHRVNMFGDFALPLNIGMRIDADYVGSLKRSLSAVDENKSEGWVRNSNRTVSDLWAAKLVLTGKIQNTEIEVGSDISHTSNNQDFASAASDNLSFLRPGEDDVKQNLYAVFGSFDWTPDQKWNVYGGIRWEATDSKYRHDNLLNSDLSRTYGNILPNIGVCFNSGIYVTLFYRASVYRPNYQSLDNNYIYVTPTLWETGNPELKTALVHRIGLNLSYKNFSLQSSFRINERNSSAVYYYDSDKGENVTKPINLPRYNSLQIVAVQRLDFGLWHPALQGVFYIQDLRYGAPRRKYDKPLYTLSMNNRFDIPGGIYAYLNIFGMGTGNQDVVYSHGAWMASLTLNKSWKRWTFILSANDLFGTWRQPFDTETNTVAYSSNREGGSQSVSLSIRYTMNSAKGKYKGKTARQDEIDRL
ncbi:outer membrane beta-barrel family protein [uncultured Muribaculum sp.]|uniref:outer membrane beta-barrel family protein n=1 Tax=uncultured Muribaculum sp. TaxID=1918613 RepID=UPI0025971239|nr:outer membrane beta-barrel family protein [uncultured Muribaculum sp.]